MSSGVYDPLVSKQKAENLFRLFKNAGVKVSLSWQKCGLELTT
jgi:predicted esterase